MDRQSAYFSTTTFSRAYDLAGPVAESALHRRNIENMQALGGMRRPDRSVQANTKYRILGFRLSAVVMQFIKDYPAAMLVIDDIRNGRSTRGFTENITSAFRSAWFQELGVPEPPRCAGPDPSVLSTWGEAVGDYDAAYILPHWLRTGAPIGIEEEIETCGVFPAVDESPERRPEQLHTNLAGWTNYVSAENEPEVVRGLLDDQARKGHCKFFDTEDELLDFLNVDSVILSKLALISKPRPDGTTKHRLIWDPLRSEVNSTVRLGERIVVPRIQDAVDDAKHLRCCRERQLGVVGVGRGGRLPQYSNAPV